MTKKTTVSKKEIWLPVVGYEGIYEVSSLGNVRSITRRYIPTGNTKSRLHKGKLLSPAYRDNYLRVALTDVHGKRKNQSVHRLVAYAFLGVPKCPKMVVDHINEVRDDNRLVNIRWATLSQNSKYSVANRKKRKLKWMNQSS